MPENLAAVYLFPRSPAFDGFPPADVADVVIDERPHFGPFTCEVCGKTGIEGLVELMDHATGQRRCPGPPDDDTTS